MPEDISQALPHVQRMLEAFNIPIVACPGYEADDLIGALVRRAAQAGFESYMVSMDKDLGQLISERTFLYKPSRMGEGVEILGLPEIQKRWGVQRPEQVADVLALMGDTSDNIPGVPGIGEKTAMKLIAQYGSVEGVFERLAELTPKLKATLEANRDLAMLSKRLATINCEAPCLVDLEQLKVQPPNEDKLKSLLVEFEFNSIGRRLFGEEFKAGRGFQAPTAPAAASAPPEPTGPTVQVSAAPAPGELDLFPEVTGSKPAAEPAPATRPKLKTIADVPHDYRLVTTPDERAALIRQFQAVDSFCFDVETTDLDPKQARLLGIAFCCQPGTAYYVAMSDQPEETAAILEELRPLFASERSEKVGHNLKYDLSVLKWHGLAVRGKLFDTMLAHSLIEPEMRHGMDYLAEVYLGYTPIPITALIGEKKAERCNMADVPVPRVAEYSAEDADVTWQLRAVLEPLLRQRGQERVFYELEAPLLPVLVEMEYEGIRVDAAALADFGRQLSKEFVNLDARICQLAKTTFNLNSPRQLGEILFEQLKICANPKRTRTGQYATDEQTLMALAADHEIVRLLLEHRAASKLKSTYADALPEAIFSKTGRIHTTYQQTATSTGRLNSQNPNLQNIPIRRESGQEIRKAFVPRDGEYLLLSADYSQIELRIIAALSREPGLLEAFRTGADVHAATAAKVYGVALEQVTPEMRRKAKMVNYGIAYGISAFGLAQRLGIARREASEIIENYFRQFAGIPRYMEETIQLARRQGYVETVTGRRRYIRDIRSANNTLRAGAERNAINAPIQGTAADMIKLAMINIQRALAGRNLKTRLLLQVHDELVFDLHRSEVETVLPLVIELMRTAIPLDVPIEVEAGTGENWLAAH
jgi:DNA polymerase-1